MGFLGKLFNVPDNRVEETIKIKYYLNPTKIN